MSPLESVTQSGLSTYTNMHNAGEYLKNVKHVCFWVYSP